MADCAKTVDFLREWYRMCGALACADCPANSQSNGHDCSCPTLKIKYPEDAIAIVQKWSDEHPVITWESKLKELLPNVDISKIIGTCCPYNLLGGEAPNMETCRSSGKYEDCVNCWQGEYKEEP